MSKVLMIEDEKLIRRVYQRIIPPCYDITFKTTVPEAIEYLASDNMPEVIVSDFNLYELTGDMILNWIDENKPVLRKRFVFCTGRPEMVDHLGVEVLKKPVHLETLLSVLNHYPSAAAVG